MGPEIKITQPKPLKKTCQILKILNSLRKKGFEYKSLGKDSIK